METVNFVYFACNIAPARGTSPGKRLCSKGSCCELWVWDLRVWLGLCCGTRRIWGICFLALQVTPKGLPAHSVSFHQPLPTYTASKKETQNIKVVAGGQFISQNRTLVTRAKAKINRASVRYKFISLLGDSLSISDPGLLQQLHGVRALHIGFLCHSQQEPSSSWSKKATAHSASGEGEEEVEDTSLPFGGTRRKLYMSRI